MPFALDQTRFLHSIKTAFAVLIGFIITKSIHFPVDQWLIVTIIVVMCAQINVGGMLQKSYMRFFGTLAGSFAAVLTLEFFAADPIITAAVIIFSVMVFSYIATGTQTYAEAGTLGAVTTIIILVGKNPTLLTALGRFLEISAGIIIAALVSHFIFPIHARNSLRKLQAKTAKQISLYYRESLIAKQSVAQAEFIIQLDEDIVKSLITQRKLAIDAARELFGKRFKLKHFIEYLRYEREMLRAITFMNIAENFSKKTNAILSDEELVENFHEKICAALDEIAQSITDKKSCKDVVIPTLAPLKKSLENYEGHLSKEDALHVNGYFFCAEVFLDRLKTFAEKVAG